jgi:glutamate racemase
MASGKAHLGIVDWGIGGLGIYNRIKSGREKITVTYLSDTGVTPYGKMSRLELISRLNLVIPFLRALEVTHLVVGCNSASTVLSFLRIDEMKVEGVIECALRVTERLHPARLALIGGRRTVLSGVYRRALAERGIAVKQRIAQPLSALIESGDVSSATLRRQCKDILSPLKGCSHLLLACTHYPAIGPLLKDLLANETVLIDPADELVRTIRRWPLSTGEADRFLTTGEPNKMRIAASKAFGTETGTVTKVRI